MSKAVELRIDEAHIECRIVGNQFRPIDEIEEIMEDAGEKRLVGKLVIADAVHGQRIRMDDLAFGIDIDMECPSGREPVDKLNAADLDDPVIKPVEASCFCIEYDFAHGITLLPKFHELANAGKWGLDVSPSILTSRRIILRISARVTSKVMARVDDEIGAGALFRIRSLACQNGVELV